MHHLLSFRLFISTSREDVCSSVNYNLLAEAGRGHILPVWYGLEGAWAMSDIRPPDAVIDIMRRLKDAGHTCYVAAVRCGTW